ncbi:hypothetical protein [Leeuwenhoekiella marinoflava]|uniref:SprT-like family protein n=2 Tax=Leeuwenhoekiella marinoflava TaxID=988 RepID=A0A4Q0P6Y9_9FLAO|nr:hypothetical protein [Leeuwenhoekiella marinoflava]RXG22387.1 hypothetical protein DSL99_3953 [Leeuwenhoekiella marinoflava]SHF31772.1 hypothetical protein SAMN02745246_02176 [Leeuwenhoekiella marinoflava DSM 3653]
MKQFSTQLIFILFLSVFLLSCSQDDFDTTKPELLNSTDQPQTNFKTPEPSAIASYLKREFKSKDKNLENSFVSYSFNNLHYETLTNTNQRIAVIPAVNKHSNVSSRILALTINDTLRSVVVSLISENNSSSASFSGDLFITDLDGNFITGKKIVNGLETFYYQNPDYSKHFWQTKSTRYYQNECQECPFSDCWYCELDEVIITVPSPSNNQAPIMWLMLDPETGGGGQGSTTNTGPSWDYGPGGGGGGYLQPIVEDKIDNQLTDPCAYQIFTELENGIFQSDVLKPEMQVPNNPENLNFSEAILKLFNDSPNTNLIIQNGNTGISNANTVGATITIGNNYLTTATQLSISRTIIHEMVHAYINALYSNVIEFSSFSFRQKIERYAVDNGYSIGSNTFHHNFMGRYVEAMAYSIYEWDKNYGTGGTLGWDYYKAMAYGGMFQVDSNGNIAAETDTFKALVPDSNERQKIADIVLNESNGNNDAKGTECD